MKTKAEALIAAVAMLEAIRYGQRFEVVDFLRQIDLMQVHLTRGQRIRVREILTEIRNRPQPAAELEQVPR